MKKKESLEHALEESGAWALATFKEDLQSTFHKLKEEVDEVHEIIEDDPYLNDENASEIFTEELVDCFLVLTSLMAVAQIPMEQLKRAVRRKIKTNKARSWKRNDDGSHSHQ
jgi:NTP pyrophosphatase (non-canonical NTP hydrolase)